VLPGASQATAAAALPDVQCPTPQLEVDAMSQASSVATVDYDNFRMDGLLVDFEDLAAAAEFALEA
jgi:uncharacterized membrane protein